MIGIRAKIERITLTKSPATGQDRVTRRTRLFYLVMAIALAGILLASRPLEPSGLPKVCLPDMLVGIPCITSGLTRGFHAISLGQVRAALAYHPLSPLLYGMTLFHLLVACLRLLGWRSRLLRIPNPVQAMLWGTIGLLFVFWVPRVLGSLLGR
jgi:hypothetical protein